MAKTKISEFDATAANNTDINSVNIAEGCAPSGINNAIRETMAALKRFQTGADGDPLTVGSNLVVTGNATLGDASGDSVTINAATVSTPNGLNFDNNTFVIDAANNRVGVGTSSPAYNLDVGSSGSTTQARIAGSSSGTSLGVLRLSGYRIAGDEGSVGAIAFTNQNTTDTTIASIYGYKEGTSATDLGYLVFNTKPTGGAIAERMRINSSGNVGIGTSSPLRTLHVSGAGDTGLMLQTTNAVNDYEIWEIQVGANASNYADLIFRTRTNAGTGGSERMRIDSSGNVLVGTSTSGNFKLDVYQSTTNSQCYIRAKNNRNRNAAVQIETGLGNYLVGVGIGTDANCFQIYDNNASAERMRIDSSGNVGIGTSSPANKLHVYKGDSGNSWSFDAGDNFILENNDSTSLNIATPASSSANILFSDADARGHGRILYQHTSDYMAFFTNGITSERVRIDSSGNLMVGKTATSDTTAGFETTPDGRTTLARSNAQALNVCRLTNDGNLVEFQQDGTTEGTISVSGTTVSYNGGHLSRWAQTTGPKDETLVKGTVLSNLDEMNVYIDADGNPVDNEQLNKVKVSDVEGDANVAGVFVNWEHDEAHNVDEINMAMTGDMIIRIAQGVTIARGDLLMSAGDGTAKPQGDDIVRSKTIAKVTSTHVTCTYADGSYCVPCVLMAC